MHTKTKFCFISFDKNRNDLKDIKMLFRKGLGQALYDEQYPAQVIKLFNRRAESVQIGLAKDRRVLGFINQRVKEMAYMADYEPQDRRIHDERLAGLYSRRNPMVKEKPSLAIEQMKDVLSACPELDGVEISPAGFKHVVLENFLDSI